MTHDELVIRIIEISGDETINWRLYPALRAVVELHKPDESEFPDEWESCVECSGNGYVAMYPCQTIQAIEKKLK
jgi:hypothetical protein